ncbi:MAG: DNA mismatch repair protein MutL [Verrucomicrobia bacterium]|nr:DNA mismatch repair protein MutL [Verrucomicrobiota bacterium]
MGFRGEALPSIASVSRFTLTTRERENPLLQKQHPLTPSLSPSDGERVAVRPGEGQSASVDDKTAKLQTESIEGTQIIVNGGKIVEVRAAGCAPGTTLEVRQLFFNLPARRKFLRSEETERAHIAHYLTLAALGHPHVAFSFTHDGRAVWQLPAAKSGEEISTRLAALRERLRAFHGAELKLIPVDFTGELSISQIAIEHDSTLDSRPSALRVWGFIGAPGVSRGTREDQNLFVNRRPIENRGLNHALIEGYHTALMKGRYPVCCLFIEIDPAEVDVNIHPAKREVKFHRERDVRGFVAQAVRAALLKFHSSPEEITSRVSPAGLRATEMGAGVSGAPASGTARSESETDSRRGGDRRSDVLGGETKIEHTAGKPSAPAKSELFPELPASPIANWPAPRAEQPPLPIGFAQTAAKPLAPSPSPSPLLSVPLRILGVIGRLYVVLESDRGLVLMDQHAAHERVLFEQMLARLEANENASSQRLLLPETVELSARDAQFLRELLPTLTRLGVALGEFGERTFLLEALPPMVKAPDARRFVLELVDELKAAGDGVNALRLGEHVVTKTVCRHAVKANDTLALPELEALLADLRRCTMPYTCPHGRPTLIEMNFRELEKKFGRTQ